MEIQNKQLELTLIRGEQLMESPVFEIYELAKTVYGENTVLNTEILSRWFSANRNIFLLVRSNNVLAGYLSCLPITAKTFLETYKEDFDEKTIDSSQICPVNSLLGQNYFGLISSIVVNPAYQSKKPVSILLRLAWVEDMLSYSEQGCLQWSISAQTLSHKGSSCMRSLGLSTIGHTTNNWQIERACLSKEDLIVIQQKLLTKLSLWLPAKPSDLPSTNPSTRSLTEQHDLLQRATRR